MKVSPMKTMQKGFTLIELMIVIAIIGILAAVAVPQYQTYTLRATTSTQVVAAMRPIQNAISEFVARRGSLPADFADLAEVGLVDPLTGLAVTADTQLASGNIASINYGTVVGDTVPVTLTFVAAGVNLAAGSAELDGNTVIITAEIARPSGAVVYWVPLGTGGGTVLAQYRPTLGEDPSP